jgi:hypothetical protein
VSTERASYVEASSAGRDAIARAVLMKEWLTRGDWRVLCACLHLTALYSVTSDVTTLGQVAKLAGLSLPRTSESLGRLRDAGVIRWEGSRKREAASLLSIVDTERDVKRLVRRKNRELRVRLNPDDTIPF